MLASDIAPVPPCQTTGLLPLEVDGKHLTPLQKNLESKGKRTSGSLSWSWHSAAAVRLHMDWPWCLVVPSLVVLYLLDAEIKLLVVQRMAHYPNSCQTAFGNFAWQACSSRCALRVQAV